MTVKRRKTPAPTGRTHRNSVEVALEILKACRNEFLPRSAICEAVGARRHIVEPHVETLLANGLLVEMTEERGNAIPARLFRVSAMWRSEGRA